MDSLAQLRHKRMAFVGGDPDEVSDPDLQGRLGRWPRQECDRVYRAAYERVSRQAEYLDRVNAARVEPLAWSLSEVFQARDRELTVAIEAEWRSDPPNVERFQSLVSEWEQACKAELDVIHGRVQSQ